MCIRRIPRTLLPLVATLAAAQGLQGQEPYRPVAPEPLRQAWRWRSFSPDIDASSISLATGPGPTVWLGTRSGVARYDGRRWTSYGSDHGLDGSPTYVVRPPTSGRVLAGTGTGLYRRVGERWSRIWPGGGGSVAVPDVEVGPDGTAWAGTDLGALRIGGGASDPTLFTTPRRAASLADTLPETRVRALPGSSVPARARSGPGADASPAARPPFRARDVDMNVERVPAAITLSVAAPIWERAWFQVVLALLMGGIAFQTYRAWSRGRELRRANEMLEERVRERTRALEEANRSLQDEIRERERLEDRLIQAQKMEAVGRMAGGIAHDFNNLLTAVKGYTTLARGELEADHPAQEELSEVMEASDRARSLVRQLLTFSRKQHVEPERVDVNEHLREVGSLLERLLGDGVELRTSLADEPLPVRIDPTRLEQVVVNLAVNARDAMRGSGIVTVRSARATVAGESDALGPDASPGRHVTIAVEDDGPGIPEEHRDQIFEPFFSTKEAGSGLGLATVYGIVTQAGGFVRVESEIGVGTRFVLYFPDELERDRV